MQDVLTEVDFCQRLTSAASVEHSVFVATASDQGLWNASSKNCSLVLHLGKMVSWYNLLEAHCGR